MLVIAGILSRNGYIDISNLVIIAFVGAVLHDIFYWYIGTKLRKAGLEKYLFFKVDRLKKYLDKIKRDSGLYIFISKFTWNLNRVTLIASGYAALPFRKLMKFSVPASIIWVTTFSALGYIFAFKTNLLKQRVEDALIWVTVFLILVVAFEVFIRKIFSNGNNNSQINENKD
jgi:membrane protein DedA with SNARE-associated domain